MRQSKGGLIASLILIQILSLVTIWSTVPDLFLTQLAFVIAGAIIVYLISKSDIKLLLSMGNVLYIISILLLVLTLVVGKNIRGSVRWIDLGLFNLQTSEIAKPMLAIFFSVYLAKIKTMNWRQFFVYILLAMIPVILVVIQPDLGSALTLIFLAFALLAFSGQLKKLILVGLVFLSIAVPLESKLLKPYQRQRLETFINPYKDPRGAGYNVIQSTIAVGSGKIFGKGVKLGTQSHLNFLPERHTDFIFASFVEEFGLMGTMVLVSSYFVLLGYSLTTLKRLPDKRSVYLSLSIFLVITFQMVVNIGMNVGIMPVTGITLPLFSYGGSSLLSFAILCGIQLRLLDLITPFEI